MKTAKHCGQSMALPIVLRSPGSISYCICRTRSSRSPYIILHTLCKVTIRGISVMYIELFPGEGLAMLHIQLLKLISHPELMIIFSAGMPTPDTHIHVVFQVCSNTVFGGVPMFFEVL